MIRTYLIAAVAAFALAAPAFAQSAPGSSAIQMQSIKVSFDDLDISRDAGASELLARIERAANRICGERPDLRQMATRLRHQACIGSAVSGAVAHVNSPRLTAFHSDGAKPVRLASR